MGKGTLGLLVVAAVAAILWLLEKNKKKSAFTEMFGIPPSKTPSRSDRLIVLNYLGNLEEQIHDLHLRSTALKTPWTGTSDEQELVEKKADHINANLRHMKRLLEDATDLAIHFGYLPAHEVGTQGLATTA